MSYSNSHGHSYGRLGGGLGAVSGGTMRNFSELPQEGLRYNVMWALPESDEDLEAMKARLVALKAMLSSHRVRDPDGRLREAMPFMDGLLSFWARNSYDRALWPGWQCGDVQCFNFGPNNGDSRQVRINEAMWELLRNADTRRPWRATDNGFVRIRQSDPLLTSHIKNALLRSGYIDHGVAASTLDNSAFVTALSRFYTEARGKGIDVGSWAGWAATGGCPSHVFPDGSCYNFGPHTQDTASGHMLRLDPKLIEYIMSGNSPRAIVAGEAVTGALQNLQIKRPIFGVVTPPVRPKPLPNALRVGARTAATIRAATQTTVLPAGYRIPLTLAPGVSLSGLPRRHRR